MHHNNISKHVGTDESEFVSLTDIWKLNGSRRAKEPRKFLDLNKTKLLISQIDREKDKKSVLIKKGRYNGGTWAVQKIAKEYMRWCSGIDIGNYGNCLLEEGALKAVEQVLNVKLIRQYQVGNFRIDGYCKETNTAYEVDESHHYVNGQP